ncbi:hypothetical protein CGCF245_v012489 [Colletotrichum fructicola]|nr:hypothetical protein CGCF245_v012489 [Colletotrichum fructicola]
MASGTATTLGTIAGVIGCITVALSLFCTCRKTSTTPHARIVANQIDLTKLDLPPNATAADVESTFRVGWDAHLQKQAGERLELENNTSYGELVWLSFYAKRGSWKHWALLMHQHKYELRRMRSMPSSATAEDPDLETGLGNGAQVEVDQEPIDDFRNSSGLGRYYKKVISKDRLYSMAMKARAAAIEANRKPEFQHPKPEVGLLYIVHIGWTNKSKAHVDEVCLNVEKSFGTYNHLKNNCQHFCRRLAAGVVTKRSQDWGWFQYMFSKDYEYVGPETIGPSGGVATLYAERLTRLKESGQIPDPLSLRIVDEHIERLKGYVRRIWQENQDFVSRQAQAAMQYDQQLQQLQQDQQDQQNDGNGIGDGGGASGG